MSRSIGFRHALPILFTLLHVGLLLYASGQRHQNLSGTYSKSSYQLVALQEGSVTWDPIEPKPLTAAYKVAILLNLPALLLAVPFTVWFFRESDIGSLYAALPFVPLVWYCIGRWFDGVLGYIVRSHAVPRAWSGLFAVVSTGLLVMGVLTVTPLNHHRTTDTYWVGTAWVVWSGLFLAMSVLSHYRHPSQLT